MSKPVPLSNLDGAKRRVRTSGVDRALQILDWLQRQQHPATSYEVAKGVGAPLSTIYSVVDDLVAKNLLERQENGTVWLGARLYHYGLTYARNLNLLSVATEEMLALSALCGETVQICGRDDDKMVVLAMAEGRDHFQVSSRVGTRIPLNWSASGRLLAGHLPLAYRLALFKRSAQTFADRQRRNQRGDAGNKCAEGPGEPVIGAVRGV
ncbi:IclR family transcriptional regulator [Candidatus Sodalis endolongispinus]|uniref:IclR family transcriptional regulator n=1 Tax=Candidatus Sodalis endolongispinus TaxID=2812662 RepID=A0ABS5YD10_9GAMM|nr:IclR family transcriptional regulator [Candidatus Sodalis endolongispinus]MBT9432867.1 IclR family transcriptional regulator [Candidatus Sodalis endolongispinus]